jgi:hypothetical protein
MQQLALYAWPPPPRARARAAAAAAAAAARCARRRAPRARRLARSLATHHNATKPPSTAL